MSTYVTVEEATTYFATRLYSSTWTSASAGDKTAALTMATNAIDRMRFRGIKKTNTQPNAFPRCYWSQSRDKELIDLVINVPAFFGEGWFCDVTTPQRVKDACCEEALALLADGNSKRRKLQQSGVKSFSISKLSETYIDNAHSNGLLSVDAKTLLQDYIAGAVRIV